MKKVNLNATSVLNKKFSIELSGYKAAEVDEFLDHVLEDYDTYEQLIRRHEMIIDEKMKLINDKDETIERMQLEIVNLKEQVEKTGRASNMALLDQIKILTKEISEMKTQHTSMHKIDI